jgi:PP-loop superfamily ATP-utilizing enzyme
MIRERITQHLRTIGYQYVTVDLQGYRTGSFNERLLGNNGAFQDKG